MSPTDENCTLPVDLSRWLDDGGRPAGGTVAEELIDGLTEFADCLEAGGEWPATMYVVIDCSESGIG